MNKQLQKRLLGIQDPRGKQGIFSRGANVYNAGTSVAHAGGGPQFGRPRKVRVQRKVISPEQVKRQAIERRMKRGH